MSFRAEIVAAGLLSLLLVGCPDSGHSHKSGADHDHGAEGHGGGDVAVPEDYVSAVAKCKELSGKIESLIAEDKLTSVHPVAADIKKIAEALAGLAKKDLPKESLRDVNLKATELAGTFSEIDAAADASKKPETVAVHNKINELIAALEKLGAGAAKATPKPSQPTKTAEHDDHDH
ncbi:MAG: hypothetical protein JKY65_10105 [Planctomycetes bacterium]|nr:hypothetical protein [Planctomycetota bacterium]